MSKDEESFPTVIGRVRDTMPCPTLTFPGGEVTPRKPTATELVLSAQQWATAAREELLDMGVFDGMRARERAIIGSKFDHLDSALAELAERLK